MAGETGGPHKGCNSASCCSPAKLWRMIQTLIKENDRKGLVEFFKDSRLEHIVRVALTSRISNDQAMFPPSQQHKLIKIQDNTVHRYLGKSFTDLNSLQLALITSSEQMVLTLLNQLRIHATPQELKKFLNHVYGQRNSSLQLAVYLKRYQVVKLLIELGCTLNHVNARNKNALDCCYYGDKDMIQLLSPKSETPKPITSDSVHIHMTTSVPEKDVAIAAAAVVVVKPTVVADVVADIDIVVKPIAHVEKVDLVEVKQENVNNILYHLDRIITQQQQQQKQQELSVQFVSLAQLKKPPDIASNSFISQQITCC